MKQVNSRLRVLVAEKELKEGRRIGIRTIVREAGCARSTVQRLMSDTIKRVPLDELAQLCAWVPCDVGDILKLSDTE